MALRFIDSCGDYYSTAQINRKWTSNVSGAVSAGTGRRGTNGLAFNTGTTYRKALSSQATWIAGMSLKISSLPASTCIIMAFFDSATEQVSLRVDTTGHLVVSRNGTTLATSANALDLNENYIEFKATINNTTGAYEARVNGVNWVSGSGANTRSTANNSADSPQFGPTNWGSAGTVIDDIYLCDGSGGANNDFLGDTRVDAVFPSGAGNSTQLTPSAGSNFQNVDDNPANDDTDYNSSSTVGQKDTYAFGDITHTPVAIFGVQVCMTARKDDAGARSIASVTRSGGSDFDGTTQALATGYTQYLQVLETDPNTAAAWTKTNLNAAEFGAKVAA